MQTTRQRWRLPPHAILLLLVPVWAVGGCQPGGPTGTQQAVEQWLLSEPATRYHADQGVGVEAWRCWINTGHGITGAETTLIQILQDERDPAMRRRAVDGLLVVGTPRSVPVLTSVLGSNQEDVATRGTAAWMLGQIGGSGALKALGQALEDADESVRISACIGLAKMGTKDAKRLLTGALLDESLRVRQAVKELSL